MEEGKKIEKIERLQSNLECFDELIITIAKFGSKMFYFGEVSTQNTFLRFHKVILNSSLFIKGEKFVE